MAVFPFCSKPDDTAPRDDMAKRLAKAVAALLEDSSADTKREVLRLVAETLPAASPVKENNVLGTVTSIFARAGQRHWTIDQVRNAVAAEGLSASDKQISNSLAYLRRRGRLTQVAYGQYYNSEIGAVEISLEDIEGVEPSRNAND